MSNHKIKNKATGYDRYINWKLFIIPLTIIIIMALIPTPKSMLDVGVEYEFGQKYVKEYFAEQLFGDGTSDLSQWQIQMVRMMEKSMMKSSFSKSSFMKLNEKWCEQNRIPSTKEHLEHIMNFTDRISIKDFSCRGHHQINRRRQNIRFCLLYMCCNLIIRQ